MNGNKKAAPFLLLAVLPVMPGVLFFAGCGSEVQETGGIGCI